ncbi:MAG TPA: MBL fold metallo-hydrolase, partial [Dehalococcoidia bacterium]|nr:MBL fold metallo-hydrolase [Dehalococcoidia bacterium]
MITLGFHGAARTVTGSRHLVSVNGQKVLLDCGLYQGRRADTYERNLNFSFIPEEVDALLLSHSHIDHIGNTPNLVKQGFKGDIHATLATVDLASVMLLDAAHIQESDIKFVNKIRQRKGMPPMEPLYDSDDIPPVTELLTGHNYNHWFTVTKDIKAILRDAGHVLGSATITLKIKDNGRELSLCYTGDLGRKNLPITRDPQIVDDAEVLIIESTYGNRLHSDNGNVKEKLAAIINKTIARNGKIFIPAFALERTQEIVYTLHQLKLEKRIPDIPVYVDSPLAIDVTNVFRLHPECFDKETNEFLRKTADPFGFSKLSYTRSAEESMALNDIKQPVIILAGSGMV